MISLEKKTFLLPKEYVVKKDRMLVLFDLSAIPRDMLITSVTFHYPLPKITEPRPVYVRELYGSWDESQLRAGIVPRRSKLQRKLKCIPGQDELEFDISSLVSKYKDKIINDGLYIRIKNTKLHLRRPPYLVLETI